MFVAFTDFKNSFVFSDLKDFFLYSTPVTVYGAAAGVEYRDAHQYTFGYYGLSKSAERRLNNTNINTSTINEKWSLKFFNISYTYTFFDKGKFECRIPLEFGLGKATIIAIDNNNLILSSKKGWITPFQFGFLVDYELTRWIGISSSIGYRKAIKGSIFNRKFDSPYYTFGLSFYFGNIKEDIMNYYKLRKASNKKSYK